MHWGSRKPLPRKLYAIVDRCERTTRFAGDVIVAAGVPIDSIFWILDGVVRLAHNDEVTICELDRGQCFGDLALSGERDRSVTTATVTSPQATLLRVPRELCEDTGGETWKHLIRDARSKFDWVPRSSSSAVQHTSAEKIVEEGSSRADSSNIAPLDDPFAIEIFDTLDRTSAHLFSRDDNISSAGVACDASNHGAAFLKRMMDRNMERRTTGVIATRGK